MREGKMNERGERDRERERERGGEKRVRVCVSSLVARRPGAKHCRLYLLPLFFPACAPPHPHALPPPPRRSTMYSLAPAPRALGRVAAGSGALSGPLSERASEQRAARPPLW